LAGYRSSQRNPTALLREARRIAIILDWVLFRAWPNFR
jgi:hypothetical protein